MEVILRNTDGHDGYTERRFRLTVDSSVKVGRSSKTGMRNVQPSVDNAFIDSPVISRDHALLTLGSDRSGRPVVFITDTGSMHGTFVSDDKLVEHTPCELHDGCTLKFGAFVYRNSENFPAREYLFYSRPWEPSTSGPAEVQGTFKVPDAETSDEESYSSSPMEMEESDFDSDSSAPEEQPLRRASDDSDSFVEGSGTGRKEIVPERVELTTEDDPALEETSDGLISFSEHQKEKDSDLYDRYFLKSAPEEAPRGTTPQPDEDSTGNSGAKQRFSPIFGLVTLRGDPPHQGAEEIQDSMSERSVDDSARSVREDSYDLESIDLEACEGMSQVSHVSLIPPAENKDLTDGTSAGNANSTALDNKPIAFDEIPTVRRGVQANTIEDLSGILFPPITPNSVPNTKGFSGAEIGDRGRLAQPMSLDRIMDEVPKEQSGALNQQSFFGRSTAGARPDTVTVESLLNFPQNTNAGHNQGVRPWSTMPLAPTNPAAGPSSIPKHPSWAPLDGFMEDQNLANSNQLPQYRQGPFAPNYHPSGVFGTEPNLAAFDMPEIEGGSLTYCYPGGDMNIKEVQKSKTSISISDILDKSPAVMAPPRHASKRKFSEIEEDNTLNQMLESQEPLKTQRESTEAKERASTLTALPTSSASSVIPTNSQAPVNQPAPAPKRRKFHASSALLGAVVGGVGVFAALAFLPETLFQ